MTEDAISQVDSIKVTPLEDLSNLVLGT
jgi:hypothetical protein